MNMLNNKLTMKGSHTCKLFKYYIHDLLLHDRFYSLPGYIIHALIVKKRPAFKMANLIQ